MCCIRKVAKKYKYCQGLENQIRKEALFWRMVLQRLFDIIITYSCN
jgi:hypothetical protein